jgi:hypothetical protein
MRRIRFARVTPDTTPNNFKARPQRRFFRIVAGMEAHFSPDVETRLQEVASANGKAEELVKDTVARMLENQARFIAGVQKASSKPIAASL